jgi:hypothetical protein
MVNSPLARGKTLGSPAVGVGVRQSLLGDATGERRRGTEWGMTVATLLSLQLGWGLWLMPAVYARCAAWRKDIDSSSPDWVVGGGKEIESEGTSWNVVHVSKCT